MDAFMLQRTPPVYTQEAFRAAFGINHFCPSSYRKHRQIYDLNQDLVPKYTILKHEAAGAWKYFVSESMEIIVEEDLEDSSVPSQAGASSEATATPVISFDTSHETPDPNSNSDYSSNSDPEEESYSSDSDTESNPVNYDMCCAYCDEPLPAAPSEELLMLKENLDAKSTLDGYDGRDASLNPHHRHIRPITATVSYCVQHRFEHKLVAMLRHATWAAAVPVNFTALKARVELLLPRLHTVTEQPWDNEFYVDLGTAISAAGTNNALGIAGEYASFRKTGTG